MIRRIFNVVNETTEFTSSEDMYASIVEIMKEPEYVAYLDSIEADILMTKNLVLKSPYELEIACDWDDVEYLKFTNNNELLVARERAREKLLAAGFSITSA